ncbi:MAG: HAD-IC family P-type ATPase, partial [Bilifractor sp.]
MGTDQNGLSPEQVNAAREKYGRNVLQEGKKKTPFQIFLGQFKDLLVIVLIVAAVISALTGDVKSTLVILGVLVLNAILGTVQEVKAQKSLDALKQLSSPHVKVMRQGQKMEIDSGDLVPGDIVLAEAGDMIAADGRIIENYSLQVNESSLTGESTNIDKKELTLTQDLPLADRVNMVYSGSLVTYGRAVICVTETGMHTEIGKIATLMNQTKEKKTPLQKNLDHFSSRLAAGILVISAVVFILQSTRGMAVMDALLFAVALAVAAIPEALGSIVTIVQAMGTQKMAKEHAIIKNLSAVESLGSVSVICSDKTGTLTQNKMTVQDI